MKKTKILLIAAISVICLSVLCSCSADSRVNGSYAGTVIGAAPFMDIS